MYLVYFTVQTVIANLTRNRVLTGERVCLLQYYFCETWRSYRRKEQETENENQILKHVRGVQHTICKGATTKVESASQDTFNDPESEIQKRRTKLWMLFN